MGAPSSRMNATRTPGDGEFGGMRICLPWSAVSRFVDGKRQVRDGLHDLWHLAMRVEAHPFDAVGTGLKAADMNTELRQVQLAVSRRGVRDAEMVISPPEPRNRPGIFAVPSLVSHR